MTPDISVVMSVYNGAGTLATTLDSVIDQRDADFEVVIVDDGSTDMTPVIAESYAVRDQRVRVLHLRRVGLTRALAAGCAAARGTFVARQDCGDRSAPDRLARQRAAFEGRSDVVLVAVGTRFFGPGGEILYDVAPDSAALQSGLSTLSIETVRGPSHHGATMFRKSAYEAVGGYRAAFDVAQDLDLWLRLFESGACVALPEIHYEETLSIGAISATRRAEQIAAARAIIDCARRRRAGATDAGALAQWRDSQSRDGQMLSTKVDAAGFYYFLGSVLCAQDPLRARAYLHRALGHAFWRPKIWFRLAQAMLRQCTGSTAARKELKRIVR